MIIILSLLFRWKLVVLGAIDGFSRMIIYLKCANNNRSSTVLNIFSEAVYIFGIPRHVRNDRGGENTLVANYMICTSWNWKGKLYMWTKCSQPDN